MKKIAITGNIASGKTLAEEYLKSLYPTIDTDKVAHSLLENFKDEIIFAFKEYEILEKGKISRKKLAKIVFDDEKLRKKLEKIIHPKIKDEIELFFEKNKNHNLVFVGIPLLFEAHFEDLFDKIIFVYANDKLRTKRLIERNNLTEKEALLRINSQIPQEEKIMKSDYVIKNETDIKSFYKELDKILEKL